MIGQISDLQAEPFSIAPKICCREVPMSKKGAPTERRMTMETVLPYAPWRQRS
jgi:hypothetical protein